MSPNIRKQLITYKVLSLYFIPIFIILIAVFLIYKVKGIEPMLFFTDTYKPGFYIGSISYLGIALWTATASICFFCAYITSGWTDKTKLFLIVTGAFTSFIMFDDLFMFHELLAEQYLGIHENYIMMAYFIFIVIYMVYFFKTILSTDYLFFLIALIMFAISIIIDLRTKVETTGWLKEYIINNRNILEAWEDVFKILGITAWFLYFLNVCRKFVARSEIRKFSE